MNRLWGTVCDSGLADSDVGTVCGKLGYSQEGKQRKGRTNTACINTACTVCLTL